MSSIGDLDQFATLVAIVARLRAPDGCPWDREQTHRSLRENLLEECYEVLEALDEGSPPKLCEELGDLLMQVMLHAQIARDAGEFAINDVIRSISSKLVHRHPHVFGNAKADTSAEVLHNWEALKRQERGAGVSLLAGIPKHLPALSRSQEMQGRVARVGFDWANLEGVMDKLTEEVNELRHAETPEQKEAEFGDLLFTLANIARRLGIDGESALREASQRFYQRWTIMEALSRERGIEIGNLSLDEQNALWEEAKRKARVNIKENFLTTYREKITLLSCWEQFLADDKFSVRTRKIALNLVGDYYCPWYYDEESGQELNVGIEQVLANPQARAVMVKDNNPAKYTSKSSRLQQCIKDFRCKTAASLRPVPMATDTEFGKTLILDSNHTLMALYQSWSRDIEIPIVEIRGQLLIRIFPADFCILYRG